MAPGEEIRSQIRETYGNLHVTVCTYQFLCLSPRVENLNSCYFGKIEDHFNSKFLKQNILEKFC